MHESAENADIDIGALFGSLKRNWIFIFLGAGLIALLVWAVCQMIAPTYRAETRILIEARETVFTRPNGMSDTDRPMLDAETVKSQVELIGSPDILLKAADDLKLADLNEFHPKQLSPVKQILVLLGLKPDPRLVPVQDQVLARIQENLAIFNVAGSRVIMVQFTAKNPQIAAQIANKIADTYIATQSGAKMQLTGDAAGWLAPEIEQLTQKLRVAETKVADFRAGADLLNTSGNISLATQQLSEISSELTRLKAQRAASEAKAESIRTALAKGVPLNSLPDVMASGIMVQLNERRGTLMAEIANLSTTLMDGHPRIRGLRAQLADLDRQIAQQGATILKSLDNEVAAARNRELEQTRELNRLKAQAAQAGNQEVELRALEREATAQRDLLQTYMARYREASTRIDRSKFPGDAQIFSRAKPPSEAYFPKILPLVSMGFVGGLLLLSVFVLLRELFSGRALNHTPLRASNNHPPLRAANSSARGANWGEVRAEQPVEPENAAIDYNSAIDYGALQHIYEANAPHLIEQELVPEPEILMEDDALETAEDAPNSVAAIASRLMMQDRRRIILLSPEGDDGSAGAVHLLRELADRSLRVVLIDLTGSGAVSRTMLDGQAPAGITDLLLNEKQFTDVIHHDLYSEADVIPVGHADPIQAMQQAERLPVIFEALETAYDFVLVETGAATAEQILNLDSEASIFVMNVADSENNQVAHTALQLHEAGQDDVIILILPQQQAA